MRDKRDVPFDYYRVGGGVFDGAGAPPLEIIPLLLRSIIFELQHAVLLDFKPRAQIAPLHNAAVKLERDAVNLRLAVAGGKNHKRRDKAQNNQQNFFLHEFISFYHFFRLSAGRLRNAGNTNGDGI